MVRFVVRKLLLAVPLLVGVLTLIWLLLELRPGDVCDAFLSEDMHPETIAAIRLRLGCDLPAALRFATQVGRALRLDFGDSLALGRPITALIRETLPNTVLLSVLAIVTGQCIGITTGIVQSVRQHRWEDTALAFGTLFFYSMPGFWLALMLQLAFTLWWPVLPSSGMTDPVMYDYLTSGQQILDRAKHLILPTLTLGLAAAAQDARYMRSSMLEVLRQDFVRTARAKGLPEWRVVLHHAFRNALLPLVTLLGLNLPFLFSGSVLVETVYGWPGMGRLIVEAINAQDVPVILGCFYVFTLLVVAGNMMADVLYGVVDPRIRVR